MKRFVSLLLVAALVLAIPVAPVFAQTNTTIQEDNVTPGTDACPCGCGKTIEEVEWTPMPTGYMGSIPEGHLYLTEDYVQSTYGMTIIAGTKVIIDLRGHTWTSKGTENRILTVQGDMWLMDTVGGGKLAPKLEDNNTGGAILLDTYELNHPSFTLVSGTLTPGKGSGQTNSGGFIYAREDSKFIMLGGMIDGVYTKSYGGAIYAANTASVEILGGIIRNCSAGIRGGAIYSASSTPVVLKNATFINNKIITSTVAANGGGAVYGVAGLSVENCTFMNNSSTSDGGALYAAGGLDMKDSAFVGNSANNGGDIGLSGKVASVIDSCSFYGGYSTLNGGSILVSATNLNIKDSLIMGAIADKQGGSVYQSGGTVTIERCELTGGISNWEGSVYCGGGNLFTLNSAVTTITDSTIRNGFAKVYGGNIALAGTTLTLNNTTVTGGTAKFHGNNIGAQAASTVTINGGTIDGDIYIPAGKPITLKGQVKIGLRNNGLATGANANIDASGLTEGSEVYISGTGNLVAAGANLDYFKGAIRTALAVGEGGAIVGATGAGYCPHCGETVTWTPYNGEKTAGHYYMSANVGSETSEGAVDTAYSYSGGADVVIDLNGKSIIDKSNRAFTTSLDGGATKLTILDSAGNGVVKSWGPGASYDGGVLFTNGELNIYGGTFVNRGGTYAGAGGILKNNGSADTTIYGGYFDASKFTNTTESAGLGGVVFCAPKTSLEIKAGHFVGSKGSYQGGILYASSEANVVISGGTFVNGVATNSGGNFYLYDGTYGKQQVSNAVIRGGKATTSAGNIRPGSGEPCIFENCYIADGTAGYGGNISATGSKATFEDCVIYGGSASSASFGGGNIYTAGTLGAVKINGCLVAGGTATNNGGNIMFNHGNHQILGGEISYGKARIGGNIYANAGNHASGGSVTIRKNAKDEVTQIFGGSANYGGNMTVTGTVNLTDAVIYGGEVSGTGTDIQLVRLSDAKADPKLTIGDGVTGGRTGVISMIAPVPDPIYGQTIPYTASNGLNEKTVIVLEGGYGEPTIMAKNGVLKVAGAKGVDEDGNAVWYADYSEAASAVGTTGIVKLYADAQLNLTKDTFVDLNGYTATVTGTGKLLGLDSTGDNYDLPKGKLTFEGACPITDKSMVYAPNGNKYVALVEGNEITFHRLGADLTTITVNVDKNGVYFKGIFAADKNLKGQIDTFGIAVSLQGMPTSDLEDAQKSQFKGADMKNGETASGVIITNIFRDTLQDAQNADRGQQKIYASTYVTMNDGTTVLMGDNGATTEDDVAWSLKDALLKMDRLIQEQPTIYRRYTNTMRAYYEKWKDSGISQWIDVKNSSFITPAKDDVIDVLMIGSSSCYYYVEEMASLAEAAGIKLRVCNVYYSGCPIDKYYEDWKINYADYQFFDTTAETLPDGTIKATRKVLGGGKTLEWCLAQGDWDVISLQSRGATVMRDYLKGVDHLEAEDIKEATEVLFPYIREQFPDAKLYLREQNAYQVGKVLTVGGGLPAYKFEDLEDQILYAAAQKDASDRMVEKFNAEPYNLNMGVMRDAEAAIFVRQGFQKADGSGMWEPYDQLCARIGFRPTSPDVSFDANDKHEGDHGHAGDIGGGQYLEGAQWLQRIVLDVGDQFGIEDHQNFDVRKIDWVPTYYYNGNVVENRFNPQQLREAAYKAATVGWTLPENFVSPVEK